MHPDEGVQQGIETSVQVRQASRDGHGQCNGLHIAAFLHLKHVDDIIQQCYIVRHMADHKHKDHNEDYMHCLVSLKVLGPKQGDSDAGVTESHEQQRQEETQGKLTAWHHSYHM